MSNNLLLRRRMLMQAGGSPTPPIIPYQQVEYLECVNYQWIDTGYKPPTNAIVEIHAMVGFKSGSSGRRFVFSDGNTGVAHYTEINGNNRFAINNGNELPILNSDTLYSTTTILKSTGATLKVIINGVEYSMSTSAYANSYWTGNLRLFQLASSYRGNGIIIGGNSIYVNGILVRDYYPVRDNLIGYYYDLVTEQLFGNAGSGAFNIGPDIN